MSERSTNALVLTDWSGSVTNVAALSDGNSVVWTLVLHSLLRDSVLIPDEALALSEGLADWFAAGEGRQVIEELFEAGALTVLAFPRQGYPTRELRDLARQNPLEARARHIAEYSTSGGLPFTATERQRQFYSLIDSILRRWPECLRERATERESYYRPMTAKMRDVLVDRFEQYKPWIDAVIGPLPEALRQDLIGYIEEPERAKRAIRQHPAALRTRKMDRGPQLTRSLFYRLADAILPEHQRLAVKKLIQSAFAAAACDSENAAGSYGPGLSELMLLPDDYSHANGELMVRAGPVLRTPLALPFPAPGLGAVLHKVRSSDAGRRLRQAVARSGAHFDFQEETAAWSDAATLLSDAVGGSSPRFGLVRTIYHLGKGAFEAAAGLTLVNGLRTPPAHGDLLAFLAEQGLDALAHGGILVAGSAAYELCRHSLERQEIRARIEEAVQFRCADIPWQPAEPSI